jgi:hypothetical protein
MIHLDNLKDFDQFIELHDEWGEMIHLDYHRELIDTGLIGAMDRETLYRDATATKETHHPIEQAGAILHDGD